MTATLRNFAERHRLKVGRDEDRSQIVPGGLGHIYQFRDERLGVVILAGTKRKWGFRRRACEGAGMELRQMGDTEGILLFDPDDDEQARVAIKTSEARTQRRLSEEHRRKLVKAGRAHRFASDDDGSSTPDTAPETPPASPTTEDTPNDLEAA